MQQKTSNLITRAKILANIREWFNKNDFFEVETPILVNCPDLSPNLNILETEIHPATVETQNFASLQNRKIKKYLITSPEFSMKKLLSLQEMNNIFTITKVFRDGEEYTGIHSIEFTMLEWYRKNADYNDVMKDTENLIDFLSANVETVFKPVYTTPFPRLKISALFKKYSKIDKVEELKLPVFTKIVHSRGYSKDRNLNYEQCFNLLFLNEIEPKLPKTPFFLIDYPAPLACLAKLKKNNPLLAERFELYINEIELCNGFSELTDGKEQLARFQHENREREKFGKPELPIDYELCEKLNFIGKAGGNALGIDRLVMILLRVKTIDKVLPF
ncbi:MAG: EF-P lysine aminoacylase EpmA [bacterium]